MKNLTELFKKLGLDSGKGLYIRSENTWQNECGFSSRVANLIENKILPDAFFCIDSKPLILFYDNPYEKKEIYKAVWNFNESPIIFILENGSVDILNGFEFLKADESLKFIGNEEKLDDFTYFELVTGKTWENYESELSHKNRVDYFLLKNIKSARLEIVKKVFPDWPPKPKREITQEEQSIIQLANNFIGKVIFVSYLIDRNVEISFEGEKKKWKRSDFCSLLKDVDKTKRFFNFLKQEDQFNGDDLFPITDNEFDIVKKSHINKILINLLDGVEISSGQQSLFDIYDFSIIPVEFISNVYESFIGENNQAEKGAYYTPLFLVEYIISQTLTKYFEENDKKYECKVLDPACGSGIFLVESLRVMVNRYMVLNEDWENDIPKFQSEIKKIAKENIFGVDKDSNAINVAIFSIYLTLLDYQDSKDIEIFQFPNIRNSNFVERDFFADTDDINSLKIKGFDFILGNPPWKRGKGENKSPLFIKYINKRKKKEKGLNPVQIEISNNEIAQAFVLRVSDFSSENTKIGLIVTSKILYNINGKGFRQYLLDRFFINQVFELAPVRREVFNTSQDKSISPSAILFYQYADTKNTDSNIIDHITLKPNRFFSLFKILTIQRNDIKKVGQSQLKTFDYLWKILVYGSYIDFNLIRRLKSENPKINDIIFHGDKYIVKQGIKRKDGDKKIDVKELNGFDFIDLNKKQLTQHHISSPLQKWELDYVGYVYRENDNVVKDMFSPPVLLIKETVNTNLESITTISRKKVVFTDKVTAVKNRNNEDDNDYYNIAALLNSEVFSYYICQTGSTTGIMIEQQIHDTEKFCFPYINNIEFKKCIKKIEATYNNAFTFNIQFYKLKKELNELVFSSFDFTKEESATISYTLEYSIPVMMKHKGYKRLFNACSFKDEYLENYATLFIDRFKSNLDDDEKKFIVEIWHSNQIIGMFFKMVPVSKYEKDIVWIGKSNDVIMKSVAGLSSGKITESLFVQKDVRGFEEEYFYVFKPNEKRLWHKAIGYLDVNEFMDALLKTAAKGENYE